MIAVDYARTQGLTDDEIVALIVEHEGFTEDEARKWLANWDAGVPVWIDRSDAGASEAPGRLQDPSGA